MMQLLGIAGAGFLITLLLSRWVPYAVVAVVLGGVSATALSLVTFYYAVNMFYAKAPMDISIFAVMALAFMGAVVARLAFDRHAVSLVKTQ